MAGVGSVLGLLGSLTEYASWRWVLFINVPIAVAIIIGSRSWSRETASAGSLDAVGAVVATLAIGALVYGLTSGNTNGWGDPVTLGCFEGAAALLPCSCCVSACIGAAVPTRIVANRSRAGAYTVMLLLGAGMLAMFYLTLYMQFVRGYSALHTGLAYLPFVIGLGIAAGGVGPRLYAKLPTRAVIAAGMFFACGLGWCAPCCRPRRTTSR